MGSYKQNEANEILAMEYYDAQNLTPTSYHDCDLLIMITVITLLWLETGDESIAKSFNW